MERVERIVVVVVGYLWKGIGSLEAVLDRVEGDDVGQILSDIDAVLIHGSHQVSQLCDGSSPCPS